MNPAVELRLRKEGAMVANAYEAILHDVGRQLNIPNLAPDRNDSCLVSLAEGIDVQLEIHPRSNKFLICFNLGSPPPGKYRENLLKECLKANAIPPPRHGIFGYSAKTESLYFFKMLDQAGLDGQKVFEQLTAMKETALLWANAIKAGDIPASTTGSSSRSTMGVFGIRP
jgi:hypothetical protein